MTRIAIVVTNQDHYEGTSVPTGLWLSELVHCTQVLERRGYDYDLVSPAGGRSPLEPRSLARPNIDAATREKHESTSYMQRLQDTLPAHSVRAHDYAGIYYTGGHGVMFDFLECDALHRLNRELFEQGAVLGAVCHGYCGLLNTTLSNGRYLLDGRHMTGFSWFEERLAGVAKLVPYNAEQQARQRGARFHKAWLPFAVHVRVDGRLITGQNPRSATLTAQRMVQRVAAATDGAQVHELASGAAQ